MGNCMRRSGSSSMVWAGDEDEDGENDNDCGSYHRQLGGRVVMVESGGCGVEADLKEKRRLLGGSSASVSSLSKSKSTREVKIKITRKELEELVGRADVQGLSVEQVLAKLINGGGDYHPDDDDHARGHQHHHLQHQRSWRPALQSIPEVN